MSATLILNAGTASPITVIVQQAGENAPTEIGTVTPSFNGADRTSVRAIKRNFGALTAYLSTADKDAVINLLKNGRQLPCSGELLADIQTQCTMRYTGARMIGGIDDPSPWEVGLAGNEVQPNSPLLRYSPGDTITGESFSRSTTASYVNVSGNVAYAAINEKRDAHYVDGVLGDGARRLLLEDARTNLCLQSSALDVSFTPRTGTWTPNYATSPDGATTAELFTPANNTSYAATAPIGVNVNGRTFTVSCWMRVAGGTKTVLIGLLSQGDGPTGIVASKTVTTTWQRFTVTLTGTETTTAFYPYFQSQNDTTAFAIWGFQVEEAPFVSSYIPTTTVAVTRAADSYSLPFTTPPQEMTVYAKFVEGGTILSTSSGRLWQISSAGDANPRFLAYTAASLYSTLHGQNILTVTSPLPVAGVLGDTIEVNSRLFGDGSVDSTQSVNGAAATSGAQSPANALAIAWSGLLCWLNSAGTVGGNGFTALQSFKIVAGARSLAEMRAA